jgi:DNA invertase Pin-like site-specific DNA recombinase
MKENKSELRFAAFIRVSTERQEKEGESLRTQKTDIQKSVEELGGSIIAWYGGQEHATPGHEKGEIDRLLADSQKKQNPFNAVIVTNADRWSRDNRKSREGLDVFLKNEIRFFIGTSEHDLVSPDHRLILGLSAEIGQFFASNQKQKSIKNRISRAKRGHPTCGKLPYGRIFNKKTETWDIDKIPVSPFNKTKQEIIAEIANRYLEGEKLPDLADEFNMNHANLHKTLTRRCGNTWVQEFRSDDLKIYEKVSITIPPLLPDNIIAAILKKAEANKTYEHGHAKHSYLLSRVVFCTHCGYTMFGQTNANGLSYYRHAHMKRVKECKHPKTWVRADELEDNVMRHLFDCFGNPQAVQKAIEEAIPDREKIRENEDRVKKNNDSIDKIKAGKEKILRLISKDAITESEAEQQLYDLKNKEFRLQTENQQINESLNNRPSADKIKEISKKVSTQFRKRTDVKLIAKKRLANHEYDQMTQKEKRSLVETVFSGKTSDGRRMGVYIEWNDKGWRFNIQGHLIDEQGLLPMSDMLKEAWTESFGPAPMQSELAKTKSASY